MSSIGIDDLGDSMKSYERRSTDRWLMAGVPVLARIDGRAFHTLTRNCERPFDEAFTVCMRETTRALVKETNATIGYTQSDEISLVWTNTDDIGNVWFSGKEHKMISTLSSLATVNFYRNCLSCSIDLGKILPTFDCRVWQVPRLSEAAKYFMWREWDAIKNSVSMVASSHYTVKELHGKDTNERKAMLFDDKGINWEDYPDKYKRGSFFGRISRVKKLTPEELVDLPEKHQARSDPDHRITRTLVEELHLPKISTMGNPSDELFRYPLLVD